MQVELFEKYKLQTKSRDTEWGELCKEFMENLNVCRVGKYAPLTLVRVAKLLKGKKLPEVYELASKCRQEAERNKSKYFETYSKVFWWEIKK